MYLFFQPLARFTTGNATSGTTRICDANAPEGKAAVFSIVRYLWSGRKEVVSQQNSSDLFLTTQSMLEEKKDALLLCERRFNNHYQFIIQRNNTKNKYLLKQYTLSCWFHASAHHTKSAMKKKNACSYDTGKLYQVNAFVCLCTIKCTTARHI